MNSFERIVKTYDYNAAVHLAACSFVPSIREAAVKRAVELGKELGFIEEELQDV